MGDRLSAETDKQYLGYTCYRDLGLKRTLLAAQRVYDKKSGNGAEGRRKKSATASYLSWAKTFNWEERARAWDLAEEDRRRETISATDRDRYLAEIESLRNTIAELGNTELAIARISLNLTQTQIEGLTQPMSKDGIENLVSLVKNAKETMGIIEGAKNVLFDAYAISELTKTLNDHRAGATDR
jgi:hypothetical protein